jgi:alpha-1,2-mannosyltransferase
MTVASLEAGTTGRRGRWLNLARARPSSFAATLAGIGVLAFVVRLIPIITGGGLGSYGRYDDGVYYTASDALTFGRVPYRDFVLLHPPGLPLVLVPFALLGRLTSDPVGMAAGRLAFMAVGAVNAVLVAALASRWGKGAGISAGLLYACWLPAVYSEQSTLLEPLGGTALLVALLLLLKRAGPTSARVQALAGVALGLACTLKIWYAAPLAAVLLWQLAARKPRIALWVAVGSGVAMTVVLLPFLLIARSAMFDMVVRDQLRRPSTVAPRAMRLYSIFGITRFFRGHGDLLLVMAWVVGVLLAAAAVVCLRNHDARVIVWLGLVNLAVLVISPSYFPHYAALTAAPFAIVFGIGVRALAMSLRPRTALSMAVFGLATLVAVLSGQQIVRAPQGTKFPGALFANAAPRGCVAADDPQALIQMNRLSRDLHEGCRVAVDVTGSTYAMFYATGPNGAEIPRADNTAFQQYLIRYLTSARSFVVLRRKGDGLSLRDARQLRRHPVLAESGRLDLRQGRLRQAQPNL